jgi:hypothetical protein
MSHLINGSHHFLGVRKNEAVNSKNRKTQWDRTNFSLSLFRLAFGGNPSTRRSAPGHASGNVVDPTCFVPLLLHTITVQRTGGQPRRLSAGPLLRCPDGDGAWPLRLPVQRNPATRGRFFLVPPAFSGLGMTLRGGRAWVFAGINSGFRSGRTGPAAWPAAHTCGCIRRSSPEAAASDVSRGSPRAPDRNPGHTAVGHRRSYGPIPSCNRNRGRASPGGGGLGGGTVARRE